MDDVFVAGWGTLTDKLCTTNGRGPSKVQNTPTDTKFKLIIFSLWPPEIIGNHFL